MNVNATVNVYVTVYVNVYVNACVDNNMGVCAGRKEACLPSG